MSVSAPGEVLTPRRDRENSARLPTHEQAESLFAAFFLHIHPYQANAFLHRDATLLGIRDGKISTPVVLAVCATAARFACPPIPQDQADCWAKEAANLALDSNETSRDNIKTALLLAIHAQHSGYFPRSHTWCAIANRQALALGLHREASGGDLRVWVDAEADRRLYLASYALERHISNGSPESVYCPADRIQIRLPCDGFNFRMGIACETPEAILEADEPRPSPWRYANVGSMGFYLRLTGARALIKRYLNSLMSGGVLSPGMGPWEPSSLFYACLNKLANIKSTLPPRLRLSGDVIRSRYEATSLGPLVMFYLWWNECHVELCRIALPGYPQSLDQASLSLAPDGWANQIRQTCLKHAQIMSSILQLLHDGARGRPLPVIYDHTLPRLVYSSVRAQLEMMGTSGVDGGLRDTLQVSFDIMLGFVSRMSVYFKSADLLVSRPHLAITPLTVLPASSSKRRRG